MSDNRRRSDRIMLTIPLRVHGTDPTGTPFNAEARTVILNRHGARIQVPRRLQSGETVRLVNTVTRREADFRVVGPVGPLTEKGGEFGVEYVESKDNIWGIHFPPPENGAESKALLECRKCHGGALMPLSLVEVEVLETSGLLSRACPHCEVTTPWGYAEKQVMMGGSAGNGTAFEEALAHASASGVEQRRHRRVALQLPAMIRDYYGGAEITKSENVSKGGFCFSSEKNYLFGQGLLVVCPYNPSAHNIETHAHIVRRQEVEGTNRKVYGVRYSPQSA